MPSICFGLNIDTNSNDYVDVPYGGSDAGTFTDGGILIGAGTAAFEATAVGAAGEILVGVAAANPKWLTAGTATYWLVAAGAADPVWTDPAGLTAGIATLATTVTLTDNDATNENNPIWFSAGAAGSGSIGAEADSDLYYNPSTGYLTATNIVGTTYGSDGSISNAELLTIDDGATTEILVGGGAGSAPVWTTAFGSGAPVRAVSPTLTGNPGLSTLLLTALTAEPTEVVGQIYRADNDTWDPCGIDGVVDYFVICTAADTYIALWDIAGNMYFSTIQAAMKVIPDADGITLTAAQMNAVIVATNASEVQIPADQCDTVTGKWITVKQTGAYAVDIAVLDAADDIYMLDGTKIEGTTHEIQTAGASGNQITLMCIAVNEWWVTGEIGTSTSEAAD